MQWLLCRARVDNQRLITDFSPKRAGAAAAGEGGGMAAEHNHHQQQQAVVTPESGPSLAQAHQQAQQAQQRQSAAFVFFDSSPPHFCFHWVVGMAAAGPAAAGRSVGVAVGRSAGMAAGGNVEVARFFSKEEAELGRGISLCWLRLHGQGGAALLQAGLLALCRWLWTLLSGPLVVWRERAVRPAEQGYQKRRSWPAC